MTLTFSSIDKAPRTLPVWQMLISDLGNPPAPRVARVLGVGVRTVDRWTARAADQVVGQRQHGADEVDGPVSLVIVCLAQLNIAPRNMGPGLSRAGCSGALRPAKFWGPDLTVTTLNWSGHQYRNGKNPRQIDGVRLA